MECIFEKTAAKTVKPCPLFEEGFKGYCTDCIDRQECIMLAVLSEMQSISKKLNSLPVR